MSSRMGLRLWCLVAIMALGAAHSQRAQASSCASACPVTGDVEIREGTQQVALGAAHSWREIAKIRNRQDFEDPSTGNIVARCAVEMTNGHIGSLSVRLQADGRHIPQIESSFNKGTGPFDAENLLEPDLLWDSKVPLQRRVSRAKMIELVDG
jgi:hypothetical protein